MLLKYDVLFFSKEKYKLTLAELNPRRWYASSEFFFFHNEISILAEYRIANNICQIQDMWFKLNLER